jgi:hypothetical protein
LLWISASRYRDDAASFADAKRARKEYECGVVPNTVADLRSADTTWMALPTGLG